MATTYEGTFTWGGTEGVPVKLSRNEHGWFCDEVNGQGWDYPGPLDPFGDWGSQVAKDSPEEALTGFLAQWNAFGSVGPDTEDGPGEVIEPGTVEMTFSGLIVREIVEA